nr:hypothetical protein [Streptomyces sp. 846.5]
MAVEAARAAGSDVDLVQAVHHALVQPAQDLAVQEDLQRQPSSSTGA